MTFHICSEANLDFAQCLGYYLAEETPASADRFAEAVDRAYDQIIEAPYRFRTDKDGVRRKPIDGFREHSVSYRVRNDNIEVVSIRHHKRKPGFWRSRL